MTPIVRLNAYCSSSNETGLWERIAQEWCRLRRSDHHPA